MIHPDTQLAEISQQVGVGVVATKNISAGALIWVKDPLDVCLQNSVVQALPSVVADQFRRNAYLNSANEWILCWDIARFVNHACDCNVVVSPMGFEIACRDIAKGEQITNDYGIFNLASEEEFNCACGAPDCRKWVDSKDLALYITAQQAKLQRAAQSVMHIDQPLWPLMHDAQKDYLIKITTHGA